MNKLYDGYMCRENKFVSAIKKYVGKPLEVTYTQEFRNLELDAANAGVYILSVVLSHVEDKIVDFYISEKL